MNPAASSSGVLGRLLAALGAAILLVLGFMFSIVLLAFVVAFGLVAFGYFWWKTRALRRALRAYHAQAAQAGADDGRVIEGVAVNVEEAGGPVQRVTEQAQTDATKPWR